MKTKIAIGSMIAVTIIVLASMTSVVGTNVSDELVEITTEVCGIDGVKNHTVKLSKEDALELENLIDDIKSRLDKAETREETAAVFKDAVVSLDEYGLLPEDMSVEEAQRLVTGGYQNPKIMNLIDKMYIRNQGFFDDNENVLCLIAGTTDDTYFARERFRHTIANFCFNLLWEWVEKYNIKILKFIFEFVFDYLLVGFLIGCATVSFLFMNIKPIAIGYTIYLGRWYYDLYAANGWIHTIGLNGIKSWKGKLWGNLPRECRFLSYPGVVGFTGLKIGCSAFDETTFYLGSALRVKIKVGLYP